MNTPEHRAPDVDDWKWQMQNRLRTAEDFDHCFNLTDSERSALTDSERPFPVSITPYYAGLIDPQDADDPLRKTMIPRLDEFVAGEGEYDDPLAEDVNSPVPGLVHRYEDRVLFLMTDHCPVYCRYCTRSRLVGGNADFEMTKRRWQQSIEYIQAHTEIHDVLISGGDPLTFSDEKLEWLLSRLADIKHLDFIRIGTKVPVVMPQRITTKLCEMLKKYHPVFMSIHVIHPNEITDESSAAFKKLADAGIPLGSQTVLLKGVNDTSACILKLMRLLLKNRVRPYYLLQCDPIKGSAHFRTKVEKGIEIIKDLRGHLSGYGIPQFILDVPNGGGKIPLVPDYITGRENDYLKITNYKGETGYSYYDG
ncbi:MAG: KamA family radical SAM protein [Lentisphaeria bacterium]|nr:KamA family radical SAM protein [Lentisphaeria bacterium]NQZ66875.1 KamA family radical SAM protein [Lentisphaeria bacterium]